MKVGEKGTRLIFRFKGNDGNTISLQYLESATITFELRGQKWTRECVVDKVNN
ncbi:hypothetical protein [Carboxydothermus hydrogenoformans]|uniref:hypothetical protein n=1 Tax=Carboxydothermus hydrogenoformans TaxID=129958 RepID=UPI0013922655|nr:hypothetical protein [Carboxydothermus hydrogenoformans]